MFDVTLSRIEDLPVLHLSGGLVLGLPVEKFAAAVRELLAANESCVVLDLEATSHIDSTGLGTLVALQRDLRQIGGGIVLAAPSQRVRSALSTMHVESILPIAETVPAAARLLTGPLDPRRSVVVAPDARTHGSEAVISRRFSIVIVRSS